MPTPSPDPNNSDGLIHILFAIVDLIGGAFVALLAYFGKTSVDRIGALEENQKQMAIDHASDRVSREELLAYFSTLREDRQRMHEENQTSISDLRSEFRQVHQRIDEMMRGNSR